MTEDNRADYNESKSKDDGSGLVNDSEGYSGTEICVVLLYITDHP